MKIDTVAASFATYRAAVLPPNASAVQVLECQRAFYAGAYFLLMGALLNIGDESTPEDDGIAQLEAIKAECEAFGAAGGAPLPTPVVDEAAPLTPDIVAELERLAMVRRAAAAAGLGLTPADIHHEAPADMVRAIRPTLEALGHHIGDDLPPGWAFALFLFTIGEGGHVFYIANAERADILVALRDFMRRQTS